MSLQQPEYINILNALKEKIKQARTKAILSVNVQLLGLYWEIGNIILKQQKREGWGAKVIKRLAQDLKSEFPDMRGFSERNLVYMQTFAASYPHIQFTQVPLAENQSSDGQGDFTQVPPAQLPSNTNLEESFAKITWYHHITILDKVKNEHERLFYIHKTIENGWSRNVLVHQIESNLYERQGKIIANFNSTLPATQSDLAIESFKNPYLFDFIGMGEQIQERELEKALISHIRNFMLELGKGFAYVGNQYNLKLEDNDYFLDLLFFNYQLNCFVIFELKIGEFKPEYAGKLNFYINTVDDNIRSENHQPTIGILLCKTPDKTVVEYALRGMNNPLGVSSYELSKKLPKNLKTDLPTIKELETVIEKEILELKKPIDKKLDKLKVLISELKQPQVKEQRNPKVCERIFSQVILPLMDAIEKNLTKITENFTRTEFNVYADSQQYNTNLEAKKSLKNKEFGEFKIEIYLRGFKPAGVKAFDIWKDVYIRNNQYNYTVEFNRHESQSPLIAKLYHELLDKNEIERIAEKFLELVVDTITQQTERIKNEKIG